MGKKIAIDQLIYAPIFTCILYIFLQTAHLDMEGIPAVLEVCGPVSARDSATTSFAALPNVAM